MEKLKPGEIPVPAGFYISSVYRYIWDSNITIVCLTNKNPTRTLESRRPGEILSHLLGEPTEDIRYSFRGSYQEIKTVPFLGGFNETFNTFQIPPKNHAKNPRSYKGLARFYPTLYKAALLGETKKELNQFAKKINLPVELEELVLSYI